MLKKLNTKWASLLLVLLTFSSCQESDEIQNQQETNIHKTDKGNLNAGKVTASIDEDASAISNLVTYALQSNPSPDTNVDIYMNWLKNNGLEMNITNSEEIRKIMYQNSIRQNMDFAINSGQFSSEEIVAINNLYDNIYRENDATFGDVISQFKNEISVLKLSDGKRNFYDKYFLSMDILNKAMPNTYGYARRKMTTSCALATAGLVLAYGALFTIELGSAGAATPVTIAGWLVASASWGDSCGH
ncbi:hypothetical protein DDI74_11145 [Chryseobacterium gleum]|uniref:hypothetical protein n=1 Tax=Chryseobacterium gleum TaxID=250 RepID=UPI00103A2C57|nr:hypothetical protein [Chryseobacterium gleum]QBJ86780.1 hypothetical protein DDI74_11145 [Chryseobacterium gleum]